MLFIKLLVFLVPLIANGKLPELQTKQAIHKIRYISENGKVTYYQKDSGEFQMSTNYNFANLLKLKSNTQYTVTASEQQERIAVMANDSFHSKLNLKKDNRIYVGKIGSSTEPTFLGDGVNPKLHLKDTWISYYQNRTDSIIFHSFNKNVKMRSIKLPKGYTPYFSPEVFLITPNDAIYTGLNKEGHQGVFFYSFLDEKFQLIYKTKKKGHKVELCVQENNLIIGDFPLLATGIGSRIISLGLFQNKFKDFQTIYTSSLPDIGNMICEREKIYFVKTIKLDTEISSRKTEVSSVNIKTNKVEILSNLQFVSHVMKMNNKILIPFRGKYLIVRGENTLKKEEIFEKDKK